MSSSHEIAKIVIGRLKDEAVKAVMGVLISRAAFFAWPVVNSVTVFLVKEVIEILYDKAALGANWLWSLVENKLELKAVIKTREKLQAILDAGHDYSKAEKEFDDATDDLIHHKFKRLPRS